MRKYSTNRKYSSTSYSKRSVKNKTTKTEQPTIKQVYENILNFVGNFLNKLKK